MTSNNLLVPVGSFCVCRKMASKWTGFGTIFRKINKKRFWGGEIRRNYKENHIRENDKEDHNRAELQYTAENNATSFKLQLFHTGYRKTVVGGRRHFLKIFVCCGFTEFIEKIARKSLDKNLTEMGSACVCTFCRLFQMSKFPYSASKIHTLKGTAGFHKLSFSAFFLDIY